MKYDIREIEKANEQVRIGKLYGWQSLVHAVGSHYDSKSFKSIQSAHKDLNPKFGNYEYALYIKIWSKIFKPTLAIDPNHKFVIPMKYVYRYIIAIAPNMGCSEVDLLLDMERLFLENNRLTKPMIEAQYGRWMPRGEIHSERDDEQRGLMKNLYNIFAINEEDVISIISYAAQKFYPEETVVTIDRAIAILSIAKEGIRLRLSQQLHHYPDAETLESVRSWTRRTLARYDSGEISFSAPELKIPDSGK